MFVDWAKAQPVCIEILEIDVSKREDREARIDRPKYQCLTYRPGGCQMQDKGFAGQGFLQERGFPGSDETAMARCAFRLRFGIRVRRIT
ncbi:MAG TPA: hypothetical protein VGM46_02445 [Mesorhizobium sp.]|jgi:hypothetical protein